MGLTSSRKHQVVAVRGASAVERDTPRHIASAVRQLMERLLTANRARVTDIISIVFTVTADLESANPATAIRNTGNYAHIPLLCAQEPRYANGMARVIRVLLHIRAIDRRAAVPVYINGAERLRSDLA